MPLRLSTRNCSIAPIIYDIFAFNRMGVVMKLSIGITVLEALATCGLHSFLLKCLIPNNTIQ
jgi:hypothetical protein